MKQLPKTIDELLNEGYYPVNTSSNPNEYKNFITGKILYIHIKKGVQLPLITETKESNQ